MQEEIIQKVKINSKQGAELHYLRPLANGETEKCVLDEPVSAAPDELIEVLMDLLPTVVNFVGLDDDWNETGAISDRLIRVSGVTLKSTEEGLGATITAQRKFLGDDGTYVAVVNTPYLKPEMLSSFEHGLLKRIVQEARAYIHSRPVQLSVLDGGEAA